MVRRLANPLMTLVVADAVVAFASLYAGAWIRFGFDLEAAGATLGPLAPRAGSFAACILIGLVTMGLYRSRQRPTLLEGLARVLAGVGVGGLTHVLFFYIFPFHNTGRLTLAIAMGVAFVALSALRLILLRVLDASPMKRRVLMFGSGRVAAKVGLLRRRSDRRRFDIVGFVPGSPAEREYAERRGMAPLFAPDAAFDDLVIDEVVVALDDRRGTFPTAQLLRHRYLGIPVRDIVDFLEYETGKIDLDVLHPGWLIFATSGHSRWGLRIAKRVFDVAAALGLLVATSPFMLVVAASVWAEEGFRAPLLYRQQRVGRGGTVFQLLKFRSMQVDAEKESGPLWASRKGDARVTRTGRLIRRFRIDELPQLVNVLRGEMSIVGPRPERPEFVQQLNHDVPLYDYRHCMQPGLTGWAQLNFPYGASVEDASEKLKYDLFYIKNASIVLDLLILMQTLEVVIWGRAISMAGPRVPEERPAPKAEEGSAQVSLFAAEKRDVA
jgi:sugar transferase (PEP-CTERM system associated)